MEIERKWMVKGWPEGLPLREEFAMRQGYISVRPTVRIREEALTGGRTDYILCFKSGGGLAREEIERSIDKALFEDLETGKVFRIVNTHLDHIGAQARILGLRQILEKLKTEQLYPDAPTMITGDFNAEPQDPEFEILKEYPEYTNVTEHIGITYHGFTEEDHPCSIDFLLVKGDIKTGEPVKWTDKEGNVWLSDHYPVCVEVE